MRLLYLLSSSRYKTNTSTVYAGKKHNFRQLLAVAHRHQIYSCQPSKIITKALLEIYNINYIYNNKGERNCMKTKFGMRLLAKSNSFGIITTLRWSCTSFPYNKTIFNINFTHLKLNFAFIHIYFIQIPHTKSCVWLKQKYREYKHFTFYLCNFYYFQKCRFYVYVTIFKVWNRSFCNNNLKSQKRFRKKNKNRKLIPGLLNIDFEKELRKSTISLVNWFLV